MNQIIFGVPGMWANRRDFVLSVARTGRFLFAGAILMEVATQKSCSVETSDFDPDFANAFRLAAQGRVSDEELQAIAGHRQVIYLLSREASIQTARDMMRFAGALLDVGGLGVKVESSGVAHSPSRWNEFRPDEPYDLLCAFVTLVGGRIFYSCGMHNFALPDCEMDASLLPPEEAAPVMNAFNQYQLAESPQLGEGHTLSFDQNQTVWRLTKGKDERFEADDPFHNPNGVWRLHSVRH